MAVGSTITNIFNELSIFVDDHFFTPANLMTIISVCLLIVAITGCIGAFKESTMLVNVVSDALVQIAMSQISTNNISHFFTSTAHLVCRAAVRRIQHGADCLTARLHDARSSRDDVASHNERITLPIQLEFTRRAGYRLYPKRRELNPNEFFLLFCVLYPFRGGWQERPGRE